MRKDIRIAGERRQRSRYPFQAAVEILPQNASVSIHGWSIDLSSRGARIKSEEAIEPGTEVIVYIAWPVMLNERVPLRLKLCGRVIRSDSGEVAVYAKRHEFVLGPRNGISLAQPAECAWATALQ